MQKQKSSKKITKRTQRPSNAPSRQHPTKTIIIVFGFAIIGTAFWIQTNALNKQSQVSMTKSEEISITIPDNESKVSGVIPLSVSTPSELAVKVNTVSFKLGDNTITDYTDPFEVNWDTTKLKNGKYKLIIQIDGEMIPANKKLTTRTIQVTN